MKGIFIRNKISVVYNICGIAAGIVLMAMLPFLWIVDNSVAFDTIFGLAFFAFFGLVVIVVCIASLLFNKGAYLNIDESGISASFGWKGELKCGYSEIDFSEYQINSLTILLKNRKRYTILNLSNADEICAEIRKNINVTDNKTTSKESLQNEILIIRKQRAKWATLTASFCGLMFLLILLAVLLTDEKEMSEFMQSDWIIFIAFIVLEAINFIVTMFFANKCGKLNPEINQKRAMLKKEILKTAPLPSGNLLRVYMDCDYIARAVIFGYPNTEDVYFIVQAIDKKYNIVTTYSSEVFSNIDELKPMLDELIQIS